MIPISVVMPVYNTSLSILKEAVDSILNQTFSNFEFIIIDDGSTNNSSAYLMSLTDPRIRIIRNDTNLGITKSLNIGFRAAKGQYIARMDSDDIAVNTRFEIQYAFMEKHPDAIVCGTRLWDYTEYIFYPRNSADKAEYYNVQLLFSNPGPIHPTAFFNRKKLIFHHIEYDENLYFAQDYAMWMTISHYGKIYYIPDKLITFRSHPNRISVTHRDLQIQYHRITLKKLLLELDNNITDDEVYLHYVYTSRFYRNTTMNPEINRWFNHLIKANKHKKIYNSKILKSTIESVKVRLIFQSFTKDMSKAAKAFLLVRYLSLPFTLHTILHIVKEKLKMILCINIL